MRTSEKTAIAILSIIIGALVAGESMAGEPRTHDGFFLRLSGGGGTARSELESGGERLELSGTSGDVNIAVGGMVSPNLALHGTLFGWLVSEPDVEISGFGSGTAANTDVDLSAFGGGLTYYFMPVNMYISASAGAGELSIDSPGVDVSTDTGFVGEITLGKEWWVGGSWGLGVAGAFGYHSIPDGDVDENWSGTSFAIRFTATLN